MKFTLIICTYKRSKVITNLLDSVAVQTLYPDEILIIDGSPDDLTKEIIDSKSYRNLSYFKVEPKDRGLTRQRNFGIDKVNTTSEIVAFLDDDTVLERHYFQKLLATYSLYPKALGVGGYIINEVNWKRVQIDYNPKLDEYYFDEHIRVDGIRFIARKKLNLDSNVSPGFSPLFGHGRSVGFLPPSDKIYEVEQLMGGVSSFKKEVFNTTQFSTYFEGYGLYEDADFTLRLAKKGKLYINTSAKLEHHHDNAGRPNKYQYGKMVVRNGWYVWRIKNTNPTFNHRFKWNAITILLTLIRATNIVNTNKRKEALTETVGRTVGWFGLIFSKPKIEKE